MKSILSLVALAAAALCALAPAAANPVLTFVPSSNTVAVANSITVDANVSGLGTDILSGFDLNFVYNPALLKMATVQYFSANLGGGSGLLLDGIQGNIGLKDISADPDVVLAAIQPDAFTLFTFTLLGLDHGATTFTLGPDATFDRKFLGLMDAQGDRASLNVDVGSVCIAVGDSVCNTVPEPSGYALAGLALLAAGFAGRSRKRGQAKACPGAAARPTMPSRLQPFPPSSSAAGSAQARLRSSTTFCATPAAGASRCWSTTSVT